MKKPTFSRIVFIALFLLMGLQSIAQNYEPFVPRYDEAIKGDMLLIGNNNLSVHKTNNYSGSTNNETSDRWVGSGRNRTLVPGNNDKMVYVDIDNDNSTFNSSSANLNVPSDTNCYQVAYAALYWTAVVKGDTPMSDIKFKTPESGSYIDITGEQIYYQDTNYNSSYNTNRSNNNVESNAYVYYRDVTDIIAELEDADGTYTVANISSMTSAQMITNYSKYNQEGLSAGWSLFVIYEDPLLPSKYITSFDGFTKINNTGPVADREQSFEIDGFRTIPLGPVRAKYAFSALEGDKNWSGDFLEINGSRISATTAGGTTIRPSNNFFNSSVSIIDPNTNAPTPFTDRNPASSNTLGFDAGIINIPNAGNSVIGNGDTSATIKLGTNTDIYYFYFNAFAIEIIAPKIVLTKIVEDAAGNNIGGQEVGLGTELNYVLSFQNTGNDDAKELTIRDILPQNIEFNYPEDLGILPNGVTVQSYNAATREIIFEVDNSIVKKYDPSIREIRFKVTVVKTCSLLNDACSNIITNQAFSFYKGTVNPDFKITDDPSFSTNTGCLLTPGATNFLADINCTFEEEVILCDPNGVKLTAGSGYDSYSWSTSPTGSPVIGTNQSIIVKTPGTYYVHNTATAPCKSIDQIFNVITYGENSVNPVLPFADEVVICPDDGKQLPNFFLCGANDIRAIETNITDTSSIIWEKLDETSCSAVPSDGPSENCANEDSSCQWNEVATGSNYNINLSGQYRITLNYEGGCFSQYYFNVYSNILVPTATSKDIICDTPGEIVVSGVPSGYEYSIDGNNYQTGNVFSIASPGVYSVYVKQIGVDSSPCIFSVPDIQIRERDFTGTAAVSQPLCHDDKGSVKLAANDARAQYYYSISKEGTLINKVGPIMESDYSFENLTPGAYTATISTEDDCSETVDFEIINPALLTATAAITRPLLACNYPEDDPDDDIKEGEGDSEGEDEEEVRGGIITMSPIGGTAPYYYFVNGATEFQSEPEIIVTAPGTYTIKVVDDNNCSYETTIQIDETPAPVFEVSSSDVLCYNSNTGEIRFNVSNANGYTISYSIDNGATYSSNPVFSNLDANTYNALIKYEISGAVCYSEVETLTIKQADDALTASAGVSELAGCGASGEGKVRITNPQGGTPPYEYSFDNQGSWIKDSIENSNEAFVAPGTYTLYIKDANGCIYAMPGITLEQEPVPPSIGVAAPDFNCDGTASATVTVTNDGSNSYSYTYLLNGVPNTNIDDPKTFLNVPDGNHTISVQYQLESVPTFSNLLYETFGYGEDTTSPGINTQYYCFERQVEATQCNGNPAINDGDYSVTSRVMHPFGTWLQPGDHTPNPNNTPKGRALVVNIGDQIPISARLYEKEINDIIPGQPIIVDFYAINLIKSQHNIYDPNLLVALVDAAGNEISSFPTGIIPKSEKWENYTTTLNPGNNTSLKFILRSNVQQVDGNDVAIDDIRVYQLPKICVTQIDFPFIVETEKAFKAEVLTAKDATCFGAEDGTITIVAQNFNLTKGFQYSLDGVTWETAMSSPVTIKDLAAENYNIQVRYDNSDNTCNVALSQLIKAPTVLEVTVTSTDITCITEGTIKAKATGGSPAYTYELLDTASLTFIKSFPSNGVLNNLPEGDYTIKATDINGCTATTTVVLVASEEPTAVISTNSIYCYDGTNGASLEVTASGGKAPYEYSINTSAFQKGKTFANLTPGNYDITVRDANGCIYKLPTEIIAPQVKVSTVITKNLDCNPSSPDAIITGTISGGYAPFTYAVSTDGGTTYTDLGATETPFSYPAATAGTYQFQITDAQGCTTTSGIRTIDPITDPEFTVTPTNILCFGDDTGSINIVIDKTKGQGPYVINVLHTTTDTDYGTRTTGLPEGSYSVTVTDAKFCFTTQNVTIAQPDLLVLDHKVDPITCGAGGVSLGRITIEGVTGGTGNYTYHVTGVNGYNNKLINQTGDTQVFEVVDFGLYEIIITDENGCSVLLQDVLVASPPDDLDIDIKDNVDCINGGEALVSIGTDLASGGPFFFSFYEGPTTLYPAGTWLPEDTSGSKSATFTGLTPGVLYTFIVYDASTNCSYYEPADKVIPTSSTLTADVLVVNNITCKGSADGTVSFTIESPYDVGTDVSYEIFNSLSLISTGITGVGNVPANGSLSVSDLGPLLFGNYYVLIKETSGPNAGCSVVTLPFNITESALELEVSAKIETNANCNPEAGVISAIAKGGTAPYLYQISTSATAPSATDGAWASANTFNVNAGQYYVHVKDAYGCIQTIPTALDLIEDPKPVVNASVTTQCDTVEGKFSIDVTLPTAGIAPYSFSINGGAFQTRTAPFTIDNLSSGEHKIIVKDANGCESEDSVIIDAPVSITPTVTGIVSCTDDDGKVTVTPMGGTAPYTYTINSSLPSITLSGNVFSGVPSGTFIVIIEDSKGCTATAEVTLEVPTKVDFTLTSNDVTCNGGTDGAITVNLPDSNDNPIYTYEITGPIAVAPQTSNVFTGLAAGFYTVQVKSGRNCVASKDVEVKEAALIVVTPHAVVDYECTTGTNATNFASISIDAVTGGSGTYTKYEFIKGGTIVQSGSNILYKETDLTGGSYTINVYDANGCVGTTTAVIKPFISLDRLNVNIDTEITCTNDEDITVSVTSSGGTPTQLEFILEDYAGIQPTQTNTTGKFTGLPVGNYKITVTNLETNCSVQTVHYINEPNTFDLAVDAVIDVTCFSVSDGSATVSIIDRVPTPNDKAGAFSYTVVDVLGNQVTSGTSPNAGPITVSGLASGTYTISTGLTNTPFCTVSKNFTITAPTAALDVTTTHTEITCVSGNNDGSISATAIGGWPGGYEFELSGASITTIPYSSNSVFTNLSEGTYTVSVRDSRGCVATALVTLTNPLPIVFAASANTSLLTCFGDSNATITATLPTGGQGSNYSYTLNTILPTTSASGPQASPVFSGLGAGTYTITVTDGYNCSETSDDIIIAQPNPMSANLVAATTASCDVDATLTLSATGGTGLYTYSTSSTFTNSATFPSSVTFSVAPGTYKYYVKDANGCVAVVTNDIKIDPVPTLEVKLSATNIDINCYGDNSGVITAVAQGGLGNYIYTLQDGSGNPIPSAVQQSPGVFTGLGAGSYVVHVQSGDCAEVSNKIEIKEPTEMIVAAPEVTNVSCYGGNNGSVKITATGGTGDIKYAISPQLNQFFDKNVFENLAPGTYDIIVQDQAGCFEILPVTITEPAAVVVSIVPGSLVEEICEGDADGSFSVTISGGTAPYSVSLDDENGVYTTGTAIQTQFDFTGLKGGDHSVFVRDSQGCESEWNITFPESVKIDPIAVIEYPCENNMPTNRVTVTVDESVEDLSELDFSLNGGAYQPSNVFNNIVPGTGHYIDVRHTNGCIQRTPLFDIGHIDQLVLLPLTDGDMNEIVATAAGGTESYQYTLNGEDYGSKNTFIITESGDYTVTVTDSSGCVATATRYFEFIDLCIPNYFTPGGNHPTWAPGCDNIYPNIEFKIFDRYGREVGSYRQGGSWDGTYKNRELPTGDYWYIIKLNDDKDDRDFVGHFTLYR